MKIIKEGKLPETIEQIKTCSKCKTKFSFTNSDIESDRDGSYVECPKCSAFISATPKTK